MSDKPYIEVYIGNLDGRGAPAAEVGKLLLAMHNLLAYLTERPEYAGLRPMLKQPTLLVEPDRQGHELALAAELAEMPKKLTEEKP